MLSGLWANPNYDDNKETRRKAIDEINSNHQYVIEQLYAKIDKNAPKPEEHPFFKAIEGLDQPIPQPHDQNLESIDQA